MDQPLTFLAFSVALDYADRWSAGGRISLVEMSADLGLCADDVCPRH